MRVIDGHRPLWMMDDEDDKIHCVDDDNDDIGDALTVMDLNMLLKENKKKRE